MIARHLLFFVVVCSFSKYSVAQSTYTKDTANKQQVHKPRPYNEIITSQVNSDNGLFIVHRQADRYLLEVPDSLLNTDILIVNRIARAAVEVHTQGVGYGGDEIGKTVIQFSRGPNYKLFVKEISHKEISSDTSDNGLSRSVFNSTLQPLVAAFDIKAFSPDSGVVIDITDYINGENNLLYFNEAYKKALFLGALQVDRSFIQSIRSFPMNMEIRTTKTYASASGSFTTFELNNSIVLLPGRRMKSRSSDSRIGYFETQFTDYDANPQGVKDVTMITRWRMEPKEEDIDRYQKGELVEPKKPIVFYIDPATPKKWVPYLIQGVNDWQAAFEKAGFKKAIYALEAPTNDPAWSLEDARHSAIVYKSSDFRNASGMHIHDPRTGEILESHINWYHNVLQLLHDWYFVQAGAVDPRARRSVYEDSLMGKLIRFVMAHEVGHTLGLRHNFGASSTVPVDSLRNREWLEKNGHTPSIMDYARFNYVAQPEDSVGEKGILARIGVYDEWAIEWGYRWFLPFSSGFQEKSFLNQWVISKLNKDKELYFGNESDFRNPKAQSEDLGDNSVKASEYGIKNLQRIAHHLVEWTSEPNDNYTELNRMYTAVINQYKRYMFHVATNVGGFVNILRTVEQPGQVINFTNRSEQKQAVIFLHKYIFTTPQWLVEADKKIFTLVGGYGFANVGEIQKEVLARITAQMTLRSLLWAETNQPFQVYSVHELLIDLERGIWSELVQAKPITVYRRNLQKNYCNRMIELMNPAVVSSPGEQFVGASNSNTDIPSVIRAHAVALKNRIGMSIPKYQDNIYKWHLEDVFNRLAKALKDNK